VSLRLRLLLLGCRWLAKPWLSRVRDPGRLRRLCDLPVRVGLVRDRGRPVDGVPGIWLHGEGDGAVILYLHGGGGIAGSPALYAGFAARLARATGLRVVLARYRLAPDHPFPAAWDDAEAVARLVMASDLGRAGVIIGGDSAGGGLGLSVLARLLADGLAPRAVFAFSPWTDMTGRSDSHRTAANADPLLPVVGFQRLVAQVLQGHSAEDPRASPLFADYPGCPPVFLTVGATEILRDDTVRLAARLGDKGVDVCLMVAPLAPHAWPVLAGFLPEADETLRGLRAWLDRVLSRP
jgi:epsilon-lactone hydrolase